MSSELAYEASDESSENELLERSLSVWKGWNSIEWDDFAPTDLDIHTACSIGHYEWVLSIILKGGHPDLDRRNHGGWTPLMYACYIGHDNIVNLLINAGCNMNLKNSRGHTPLMLAASCGNESVARTLVRKGADLELIDKTGWTALFHATYAGHQNFVAFLLEAGANKNAVEPSSGTTPFMEAVAEGHEIIAQLFLQHGVDVTARAHNGYMARSLALLNGHIKIVSLIDNHVLPMCYLRSDPGSSQETHLRKQHSSVHNQRLKSQGPSIRDGPDAIARMIDRTNLEVSKGFVPFPLGGVEKEETKMSYRDVTSPINPEDYKDSSGSRAMSDLDDFNDDSNAFSKTGAITIKSSSSSSGGFLAALGLSHAGSLDSDDSHSYDQTGISSDDILEETKVKVEGEERENDSNNKIHFSHDHPKCEDGHIDLSCSGKEHVHSFSNILRHSEESSNNTSCMDLAIKESSNVLVSPLRDYFPLETSFSIGKVVPESAEPDSIGKEPSIIHQELSPNYSLILPKDNMTQVEIVNRFLKNLTVNNFENSNGQNRWAEETRSCQSTKNERNGIQIQQNLIHDHCTTATMVYDVVGTSSRKSSSSKIVACKDVQYNNSASVLSSESSVSRISLSENDLQEVSSVELTDHIGSSTLECSSNSSTSVNIQVQSFVPSHLKHHHHKDTVEHHKDTDEHHHKNTDEKHHKDTVKHHKDTVKHHHKDTGDQHHKDTFKHHHKDTGEHHKDTVKHHHKDTVKHHHKDTVEQHHKDTVKHHHKNTVEHLSHQLWTHQPRLNHHHPLNSRHHHNHTPLSHLPDHSGSSVKYPIGLSTEQVPISHTSAVNQSEPVVPFIHALPQEYFYRDYEAAGPCHFGPTTDASIHPTSSVINTSSSQGRYQLPPVPYSLSSLLMSPNVNNTKLNLQDKDETQSLLAHMGQINEMTNQHLPLHHGVDQTSFISKDFPFIQQLPALSTVDENAGKHQFPSNKKNILQKHSLQSAVTSQYTVTAQPTCGIIDWGTSGLPERSGPRDLAEMLTLLGLTKYLEMFIEQDVDLQVFLSMTDNDLKELGVRLFGPRKKMTNAIARWHSNAPISGNSQEQAYADKLEGEMQEMAIQLNQACENEERLKAQVLQEQQLRSVTESCLMEERVNWEQACQNLLNSKTKMHVMGDLISKIRVYHNELRKQLDGSSKHVSDKIVNEDSKQEPSSTSRLPLVTSESCVSVGDTGTGTDKRVGNSKSNFCKTGNELLKKSEKCLKEMQQTLSSFIMCVEHLLTSTHNVSDIDKERT